MKYFIHENFFFLFQSFVHTTHNVGSLFPDQGFNLLPLHWKHEVLTNEPPWKPIKMKQFRHKSSKTL